jgi:hypothetical protein
LPAALARLGCDDVLVAHGDTGPPSRSGF